MATMSRKMTLGDHGVRFISQRGGELRGHTSRVFSVRYSNTEPHILASAGWDGTVQIWDTRKNAPLRHISGVNVCGDGLAFDPSGNTLLTGSYRKERSLLAWDWRTLEPVGDYTNELEHSWVYGCQVLPSAPALVATVGAKQNEARLVEAATKIVRARRAARRCKPPRTASPRLTPPRRPR